MQGEIRFRAWHNQKKVMVEWGFMDRLNDLYDALRCNHYDVPSKTYNIMQYTGLKDSRGIEIYEGDILHFAKGLRNDACGSPLPIATDMTVEWDNYGWSPFIHEGYSGGIMFDEKNCEVIGNIYENKDML